MARSKPTNLNAGPKGWVSRLAIAAFADSRSLRFVFLLGNMVVDGSEMSGSVTGNSAPSAVLDYERLSIEMITSVNANGLQLISTSFSVSISIWGSELANVSSRVTDTKRRVANHRLAFPGSELRNHCSHFIPQSYHSPATNLAAGYWLLAPVFPLPCATARTERRAFFRCGCGRRFCR